jgi:hypothetical protein
LQKAESEVAVKQIIGRCNNHARQSTTPFNFEEHVRNFEFPEAEPCGEGPDGVFDHCADAAAFIDKIVVGINGIRRKRILPSIQKSFNYPVGGPGGLYARSLHAVCKVSLTPIEMKYCVLKNLRQVPQVRLAVRSEWMPLTGSKLLLLQSALFRKGAETYPSNVELTFDVTGFSIGHFQNVCTANRRTGRVLSSDTGATVYYGSPRSNWQLRVYQKKVALRIEFVFRLPFLRQHDIHTPHDICKLARIDLKHLITFSDPTLAARLLRMLQKLIW